jgi:hypothetical protein
MNNATKIDGVLLGYWKDSPEHSIKDKHAIYGICRNKTLEAPVLLINVE